MPVLQQTPTAATARLAIVAGALRQGKCYGQSIRVPSPSESLHALAENNAGPGNVLTCVNANACGCLLLPVKHATVHHDDKVSCQRTHLTEPSQCRSPGKQ